MQTKTIVVLANSVKRSVRCLAGKEISDIGENWKVGQWIRPVTTESGDGVPVYSMRQALGHDPELLEIVEIPFEKAVPLPDQPENWLLATPIKAKTWKSMGKLTWGDLSGLVDSPDSLWNDPKAGTRRVKEGFPRKMQKPSSLYLIKPDKIESIKVWSEPNTYPGASVPVKRKRVLKFLYGGVLHECDIDDPLFAEKHFRKFPSQNEAVRYIQLASPEDTHICISLTGSFREHHYKIAAAFFEPPE